MTLDALFFLMPSPAQETQHEVVGSSAHITLKSKGQLGLNQAQW